MRKIFFLGAERSVVRSLMQDIGVRRCGVSYWRVSKMNQDSRSELIEDLKCFEEVMFEPQFPPSVEEVGPVLDDYLASMLEFREAGVNLFVRVPDFGISPEIRDEFFSRGVEAGLSIAYPFSSEEPIPDKPFVSVIHRQKKTTTRQHALYLELQRKVEKYHVSRLTNMRFYLYHSPYSSDTAAWLNGIRYGMTYIYRVGKIYSYRFSDAYKIRAGLYELCERYDVDYRELLDGTTGAKPTASQAYAINKVNLIAWHQFAEGE